MPETLNLEAVKELLSTYKQMMYKIAYSILHKKTDAEDAVQDASLWIINNFKKIYDIPCNERGFYIASIIRSASINLLNKRKRHIEYDIDEYEEKIVSDLSAEEAVISKCTVEEIKEALKELSDSDYILMYLYAFKEMKPKEIAEIMGISEKNIRVYILRARKRLIQVLKRRGFNYEL